MGEPRGPDFALGRDSPFPEETEFVDCVERREGLLDADPGDGGGLTEERLDALGRWFFFVGEDILRAVDKKDRSEPYPFNFFINAVRIILW